MTPKFKVGDRVKWEVHSFGKTFWRQGSVVEVLDNKDYKQYRVEFSTTSLYCKSATRIKYEKFLMKVDDDDTGFPRKDNMTPKFKVGDLVKWEIGTKMPWHEGIITKVLPRNDEDYNRYEVEFSFHVSADLPVTKIKYVKYEKFLMKVDIPTIPNGWEFTGPSETTNRSTWKRIGESAEVNQDYVLTESDKITFEPCNHSWKSYVGLNQIFVYCEHCDKRK